MLSLWELTVVIKPYSQHKSSITTKYNNIDYSEYLGLQQELQKFNSPDFNVVFRINTISNWISQIRIVIVSVWRHLLFGPILWLLAMSMVAVPICDDRFLLGNINEDPFYDIWNSNSRMEHAKFVKWPVFPNVS